MNSKLQSSAGKLGKLVITSATSWTLAVANPNAGVHRFSIPWVADKWKTRERALAKMLILDLQVAHTCPPPQGEGAVPLANCVPPSDNTPSLEDYLLLLNGMNRWWCAGGQSSYWYPGGEICWLNDLSWVWIAGKVGRRDGCNGFGVWKFAYFLWSLECFYVIFF